MGSSGKRIAIVMASFRVGGAERAMVNLANGFQKDGMKVEMVVVEKEGEFMNSVKNVHAILYSFLENILPLNYLMFL
jgi:hypothetical protein